MERFKDSPMFRAMRRVRDQMTKPRAFEDYNKVFCLGWLKTGTTSFGAAMRRLGYKHCGWNESAYGWFKSGAIDKVIRFADRYESFDDLPWNHLDMLEPLDRAFPGSKFVLLERDGESWFTSYLLHTIKHGYAPRPEKEASIKDYLDRQAAIRQYFRDTDPGRLLVMNIIQGQGYETLCPFLGVPVLPEAFPHINSTPKD